MAFHLVVRLFGIAMIAQPTIGILRYAIMTSKVVRPGQTAGVHINLYSTNIESSRVRLELKDGTTLLQSWEGTVSHRFGKFLDIQLPDAIKSSYLKLTVTGLDNFPFTSYRSIRVNRNVHGGFIQTDKGMYNPGNTVRYRILFLDPELKTYKGKFNITIKDPAQNLIKQDFDVYEESGLVEGMLQLSDEPLLGEWTITVKAKGLTTKTKTFDVRQYVLPRFEVTIVPTKTYVAISDKSMSGVVKAKYSSGKPIKGQVRLTVKADYWNIYMRINGVRYTTQPTIQETLTINGEAQFSYDMTQLQNLTSYLDHRTIIVQASVVEDLTGEIMNATSRIKVYRSDEKIEIPRSNSNNFKGGIQYEGNLRILRQDEQLMDSYDKNVTIVVTYEYEVKRTVPDYYNYGHYPIPNRYNNYGHGYYPQTGTKTLATIQQSVPSNGIVRLIVPTHKDAISLRLKATYGQAYAYITLNPYKSQGDAALKIKLLTSRIEIGKQVNVRLESNKPFDTFTFAFISKGKIIRAHKATTNQPVTEWNLSFNAVHVMAPKVTLLVFTVDGNEIIPDAISLNIQGPYSQQVSMDFDADEVKPGGKVNVTIRAKPGSLAASLIVDKSVVQLKSGFDLSTGEISDFLKSLDVGSSSLPSYRRKRSSFMYPVYINAKDSSDLIRDAGIELSTDGLVYVYIQPTRDYDYFMPIPGTMIPTPGTPTNYIKPLPNVRPALSQVDRIRNRFPETWLWGITSIGDSGEAVIPLVAPDSLTTWVATAFVINDQYGFGITDNPSKIVVIKKFYVNVILPYSVLRGEEIVLQANVFNYYDVGIEAHIELLQSDDFDCLDIDDTGAVAVAKCGKQTIHIQANSATSVFFPIIPKSLGEINVTVTTRSACLSDGVTKTMIIESEGIPTEYNLGVIVDLVDLNVTSFQETLPITFPPNLVEGSARVVVDVLGHALTKTLSGLSGLIKMSYGCGEQNIATFAPTVFVSNYLESVGELTEEMKMRATDYIAKGYQRQMNYMRRDGSFSAFGDRDSAGSTWLTIFAVKTFIEARAYISIDEARLRSAIQYIYYHTNSDGSIHEEGRIHHRSLQGGSASGIGLSAYALSSLTQDSLFSGLEDGLRPNIESQILNLTDPYLIAISAYALELSNSILLPQVRQKLMDAAIIKDGMMHWESHNAAKPHYYWKPPRIQASAGSIEATGYGLLACLLGPDITKCLPAVKWLTAQQNSLGGYVSTQDTVIAVKALAEAARVQKADNYNISLGITSGGQTRNFLVSNANQFVLQSAIVQGKPDQVVVRGTGHGRAIVQISVRYNIQDEIVEPSFSVNLTITDESRSGFTLRICTYYLLPNSSDMAYIDVQMPTGFSPADDTESKLKYFGKRVEVSEKKVILYLDEIGQEKFCFHVEAKRNGLVSTAKPVTVTVLDYYNPDNKAVAFYLPDSLKGGDFCDVCDATSCGMCSRKRKK